MGVASTRRHKQSLSTCIIVSMKAGRLRKTGDPGTAAPCQAVLSSPKTEKNSSLSDRWRIGRPVLTRGKDWGKRKRERSGEECRAVIIGGCSSRYR